MQRQGVCDALVPRRRCAEQHAVELGPLVEQVQIVLPRVADGAVKGQRAVGEFGGVDR